ncbi:MAG: hypothetical protein QOC82_2464 [Frankiaceae bacterium]|nr:hypothetical protein [Frankiaceae bacterium]
MSARFARLMIAGAAVCVVAPFAGAAAAFAATTSTPTAGDQRATAYPGNLHDGKTSACSQLGFDGDTEVAVNGSGGYSANDFVITSDGSNLTVSAIPDGTQIHALVVKGGDAYNVYSSSVFATLPVSGLHAPMVGLAQDNVPTISHWFLCDGEPTEVPLVVPTSGGVTGDCTKATVTIDGGSDAASVRIDPSGVDAAHDVSVPAGTESVVDIDVSAAHPTVTATDKTNSNQLGTYSRPTSCDSGSSDGGAVDPKVSFGTSCAHGIQVVMSNMKLDDTTTDDVTFTVVTPAGATEHVIVAADHIVKRTYNVAEGKTGVVTVSAPGMTTATKSYAKKCTHVLGEKVVRTPKHPTVLGEKVTRLPFTGLPTWEMSLVAAGLCASGAFLTRAGRRRPVFAAPGMAYYPRHRSYPARGVQGR